MKKVLITGNNSYVGNAVKQYLQQFPEGYQIDTISLRDSSWSRQDFSQYDVLFHVAGIAHSDSGKISAEKEKLYRSVNTDLTIDVANKAKSDGIRQFIFMSSAIVYGDSAPIGKEKVITRDTVPSPANCYGDSKLQAEIGIQLLNDEKFKVVILRPPMIYGKGSKGNFPMLEKLACKLPVFPSIRNARSMLYIGNLVEFVRLVIDNEDSGIYWPCNKETSNTSQLVKMISEAKGKKIIMVPGISWILKLLSHITGLVNKAFGNLSYDEHLGDYKQDYRKYTLDESIRETEGIY